VKKKKDKEIEQRDVADLMKAHVLYGNFDRKEEENYIGS
jgi:hypothetical protein